MKIVVTIARYLLGLMFTVFGLNSFFNFIKSGPMPPGQAGEFLGILMSTHYIYAVGSIMAVAGVLLLANRYVPLALALLAPILYNILLFHLFMNPSGIAMGVICSFLWLLVAWHIRKAFSCLFVKRLAD